MKLFLVLVQKFYDDLTNNLGPKVYTIHIFIDLSLGWVVPGTILVGPIPFLEDLRRWGLRLTRGDTRT